MLGVSSGEYGFPGNWARSCDTCRMSVCKLYCHTDSAYLCTDCDKCIHTAKPLSLQHKRVWVCTLCKNAPAAFNCKADAAFLCINCDAEIHSANPLACCHIRDPEPPIGFLYVPSATYMDELLGLTLDIDNEFAVNKANEEIDEDETDSWLLLNPKNIASHTNDGLSYGGEVDKYLDLTEHNSCTRNQYQDQYKEQQSYIVPQGEDVSECAMPVLWTEANEQQQQLQEQEQNIYWGLNHEASKSGFFCTRSSSPSVHMPSMDPSIVPVATISNISNSYMGPSKGTTDLVRNPPLLMPLQFNLMDREAKVLRYRERRKARKFEKKIRYASRKAYADTRPRVKGRFARRIDVELEMDEMFSIKEYCYGIFRHSEVQQ